MKPIKQPTSAKQLADNQKSLEILFSLVCNISDQSIISLACSNRKISVSGHKTPSPGACLAACQQMISVGERHNLIEIIKNLCLLTAAAFTKIPMVLSLSCHCPSLILWSTASYHNKLLLWFSVACSHHPKRTNSPAVSMCRLESKWKFTVKGKQVTGDHFSKQWRWTTNSPFLQFDNWILTRLLSGMLILPNRKQTVCTQWTATTQNLQPRFWASPIVHDILITPANSHQENSKDRTIHGDQFHTHYIAALTITHPPNHPNNINQDCCYVPIIDHHHSFLCRCQTIMMDLYSNVLGGNIAVVVCSYPHLPILKQ